MNQTLEKPSFIKKDFDLQSFNTMACPSSAEYFANILNTEQLQQVYQWAQLQEIECLVLGEGSNLLLAPSIKGCVINIKNTGINITEQNEETFSVRVNAGENWHDLVCQLAAKNINGLENLSFIPGSVGASPVQNIGAYGVEVGDLIQSVEYFDPTTLTVKQISQKDCLFSYRDSIFKSGSLKHVIILNVTFLLSKIFNPIKNYAGLPERVESSKQWIESIGQLRWSKLPNPIDIPNAGSFFKNPVLKKEAFQKIKKEHPEIVSFDYNEKIKVPAAWLIDQLGFKGVINDHGVGCYKKQALVLVNTKKQSREKILEKAFEIQQKVKQHFNIELEIEPQLLG